MRLLFVILLLTSCASREISEFQFGCIYGTVGILREKAEYSRVVTYCENLESLHKEPTNVRPIAEPKNFPVKGVDI